MKYNGRLLFLLTLLFLGLMPPSYGAYSLVKGQWLDEKHLPSASVQEHYELMIKSMEQKNWDEALRHCVIITKSFGETPFYNDAIFFSGICYFKLSEYDLANKQFSLYLTQRGNTKHFEAVFEYKFRIAEKYREGARRHMFGYDKMPKWSTGRGEALKLYDEISISLPNKDLAARALFSKGLLLHTKEEFRESIDAYQVLIRRFPKHPLSIEAYLNISKIYLEQSEIESQNPDILALAQINFRRFQKAFPGDERIEGAQHDLISMKEFFAVSLYETGRFYERKKKPQAAAIYYNDAIRRYPETPSADRSRERLTLLKENNIESSIAQKTVRSSPKVSS